MAGLIDDSIFLCDDCTIALVNGDVSGMNEERTASVLRAITDMTSAFCEYYNAEVSFAANFDSESGEGVYDYKRLRCDCCKALPGPRHRFAAFSI